jgi:hypothetical protein
VFCFLNAIINKESVFNVEVLILQEKVKYNLRMPCVVFGESLISNKLEENVVCAHHFLYKVDSHDTHVPMKRGAP